MTLLRGDQLQDFDVAIDGVGYILDEDSDSPFQLQAPDELLARTSIDTQLEQNKLDDMYWGSNRSWHEGQGQIRLDVPPRFAIDPTTASSPYKHLRSKGVDITTRGQLTLLERCGAYAILSNQDPIPAKMAATDTYVYVATAPLTYLRFSAPDASDSFFGSIGGTAGQATLDLESDGAVMYAAQGADGIYQAPTVTTTQIDAMDSLTTWGAASGSNALSTSLKKEGTASIAFTVAATTTGTATKTFGASQNYSTKDQFSIWVNSTYVPPAGLTSSVATIRFVTSTGNYFGRTFALPHNSWYQLFIPLTGGSGWDSVVGTPNLNNINSIQIIFANASASSAVLYFDDLRAVNANAFASWGTWDARVLGWCNDRLCAAGIKTGTQWRFYVAAVGAGGQEVYVLNDGWVVTSIQALSGLVYFSAYRGGKGVVYSWDGVNSPQVAVQITALGEGTIPLVLIPFSGAGMLIGCRRLTSTGGAGLGVLYRGFPDAAGALRLERMAIIGLDDGRDYGIRAGCSYGDFAYFGWNYGDEVPGENFLVNQQKRTGLGVYWPETGAYGRSYLSDGSIPASGIVEDCLVFKGLRMFSVGANYVHIQQPGLYELEGGFVSSLIDINVMADKIWLAQQTYYANPAAISSPVAHAYSLDGFTWLNDTAGAVNSVAAGDTRPVNLKTSFATLGLRSPSIYARVRMVQTYQLGPAGVYISYTPAVYFTGIGGYPATKPLFTAVLSIRAYPSSERLEGGRTHDRAAGYAVLARLVTLWTNQTIVDFQPPWAFSDPAQPNGISYKVRISDVLVEKGWNANPSTPGGIVSAKLKAVP